MCVQGEICGLAKNHAITGLKKKVLLYFYLIKLTKEANKTVWQKWNLLVHQHSHVFLFCKVLAQGCLAPQDLGTHQCMSLAWDTLLKQ